MNQERDLERRVRTWLDEEGPQDVPGRVVDAAIEQAASTARLRPLPGFIASIVSGVESTAASRQMPLARTWVAIALVLMLLTLSLVAAGAFLLFADSYERTGSIAFDSDGDIWIVGTRPGDEPVRHTDTLGLEEADPVWSPDGKRLAYWVTDVASSEIRVFDFETGRTTYLRDPDDMLLPLGGRIFGWSPDGGRIAAPARGASEDGAVVGIETVVVFDLATGSAQRIPFDGNTWSFGWSPDGTLLGLVGEGDLFVHDAASGDIRPVRGDRQSGQTDHPYWLRDIPPVFAADGSSIIFTEGAGEAGQGGDIWSFPLDGGPAERLVSSASNELAPVVSADGTSLAFGVSPAVTVAGALAGERESGLASDIVVIPGDGGEARTIAGGVRPGMAWSPDGRRIVSRSFDGSGLVIIDADRPGEPYRISPTQGEVGSYSWGPQPP